MDEADIDQMMDLRAKVAMENKERMVKREGIGTDLVPTLELHRDGDTIALVPLMGDRDDVFRVIRAAVAMSGADFVVHLSEAFCYRGKNLPGNMRVGRLAELFAQGDPNVAEEVMLTGFTPDGRTFMRRHAYLYDGRTVVWLDSPDPNDDVRQLTGDLPAIVMTGFEEQFLVPATTEQLTTALGMLGVEAVLVAHPVTPSVPRNRLCPCGSGLKAKRCCNP